MASPGPAGELARYVQPLQREMWSRRGGPPSGPESETAEGAVLLVDAVGFTRHAVALDRTGPEGAEQLARRLDAVFAPLVDGMDGAGATVVTIIGDAVLGCWLAGPDRTVADCVAHATAAGHRLVRHEGETAAPRLRASVASGPLTVSEVGGLDGRWLPLLHGRATSSLGTVDRAGEPDRVTLSAEAWSAVSGRGSGRPTVNGCTVLLDWSDEPTEAVDGQPPNSALDIGAPVTSLLPPAVAHSLSSAGHDLLDEFRTVTALFVGLRSEGSDQAVQCTAKSAQEACAAFGGTVDKICADDKGIWLLAVFGYPGQASPHTAARAVRAARQIVESTGRESVAVAIGVGTGRVFCGSFGGHSFRQYTAIGPTVNRAARAMTASAAGEIVCDEATAKAADLYFDRQSRGSISGKEGEEPFAFYSLSPRRKADRTGTGTVPLVGRAAEVATATRRVADLVERGTGSRTVVVGEAGIGKSRLLDAVRDAARRSGAHVLSAAADPVNFNDPYHAVETLVLDLLGAVDLDLVERAAVAVEWAVRRGCADLAPTLNPVIGTSIPESPRTEAMGDQIRAAATARLVGEMLEDRGSSAPVVVVVDDAHWADSASLAVVSQLAQVENLALFVGTRPVADPLPGLAALLEFEAIELGPLDRSGVEALAASTFGAGRLDSRLRDEIADVSGGNPFHVEEIALALGQAGTISVTDGVAALKDRTRSVRDVAPTDDVSAVVQSRVDAIEAPARLSVRAAAAIGQTFEEHAVAALVGERVPVARCLTTLRSTRLIEPRGPGVWGFRHALTQQCVYDRTPFEQRRRFHRAAAGYLERSGATPATLAHHWTEAGDWDRALEYLERAGDAALASNAAAEAVKLFDRALVAVAESSIDVDPLRVASWKARAAEAWYRQGRMDRTIERAPAALRELGHDFAVTKAGMIGGTLRALLRPKTSVERRATEADDEAVAALDRALQLNNRLTEAFIFEQDPLGCIYAATKELQLARSLDRGPELARARTTLSLVLGVTPFRPLGARMLRRARTAIEGDATPPAITAYVLIRGAAFHIQGGDFGPTRTDLDRAVAICEALGDLRLAGEAVGVRAFVEHYSGRHDAASEAYETGVAWARSANDDQYVALFLAGLAEMDLRAGRLDAAERRLAEVVPWARTEAASAEFIATVGANALLALRRNDLRKARADATACLERISAEPPVAFWTNVGVTDTCEVLLELWRRSGPTAAERDELRHLARRAVRQMWLYSLVFGLGRPFAHYYSGRYHRLVGRERVARARFERAATLARRRDMLWELDLAQRALGDGT